ncbi:DUF6344 domain-containing protein [Streptomyces djakartensis]|uniref:Secreted protein n=1 Tax=Streptomyces djakartensis TaxID=68193 RepID=A0ABQ2ZYQ6_9ACTN|nr:DUF6344 domain-containing protein [Streptomyces djakartensis]GGY29117.1 hypothetical protein GCM10010384_40150 [Streptomyces djakartensis]
MARNKVMTLWTVIVTAFLALCQKLGLVTATVAAAVPQTEPMRNSERIPHQRTVSVTSARSYARALPPTMKQRIRAEAHGKTPRCRHRPLADSPASPGVDCAHADSEIEADPTAHRLIPMQP